MVLGGLLLTTVALGAWVAVVRILEPPKELEITLWSAVDQPLRSAWVELRCGRERHRVVSNARGGIPLPESCRETPIVEGFDLLRTEHVGKEPRFHFSARGTLRFELIDLKGSPLPNVPTTITLHHGTDAVTLADTQRGVAEFPNMPLALSTRLIQVIPNSREWRFADLRANREGKEVVYSVRLERHRSVPVEIPVDGILT
jgi:hypothetical protein